MCYLPDWQCLERKQNFHSRVWSLSVKVITVSLNTKENPLKSLHWNLISEKKKMINIQWSSLRNWNISCPDLGQDQASSLNEGLVFIVDSKEFASNLSCNTNLHPSMTIGIHNEKQNPFSPNCVPDTFAAFLQPFSNPLLQPLLRPFHSLAQPFSKRRRGPGTSFFGKVLWTCSTKAFLMQQGAAAVV